MSVISARTDDHLVYLIDQAAAQAGMKRSEWVLSAITMGLVCAGQLTPAEAAARQLTPTTRNGHRPHGDG